MLSRSKHGLGTVRPRLQRRLFCPESPELPWINRLQRTVTTNKSNGHGGKWWLLILRWTIAVVGIGWVLLNIPLYDKVTIVDPADGHPLKLTLAEDVGDQVPATLKIIDPRKKIIREIPRTDLVNSPDTKWVLVREPSGRERERLLALDLSDDLKTVRRFLVENAGGKGVWVPPDRVVNYTLGVPYPLVDQGIIPMIRKADRRFLWAAVLIFPITFLITSLRWHLLLSAVDIHIGLLRTLVINMVGAFYNTFMPGSTGGDVLKAYYAAKLSPGHRTRAVVSVIVDRAIGLLALIILGGALAAALAFSPHPVDDPAAARCAQVATGALLICLAAVAGLCGALHSLAATDHRLRFFRQTSSHADADRKSAAHDGTLSPPAGAGADDAGDDVSRACDGDRFRQFRGKSIRIAADERILLGCRARRRTGRLDPDFAAGGRRDGILRDPADQPAGMHRQPGIRADDVDPSRANLLESLGRYLCSSRRIPRADDQGARVDRK